jgi:hypothetical protein
MWIPQTSDPYMELGEVYWTPETQCEIGLSLSHGVKYLYPGVKLYAYVFPFSYCWAIVKNYAKTNLTPFNRHKFTVTSKVTTSSVGSIAYLSSGVGAWVYTQNPYVIQLRNKTVQSNRLEMFFATHYKTDASWPGPAPEPGGSDWHWIIFHDDYMVFCYFLANQPLDETSTVNMTEETFESLMEKIAPGVETKGISSPPFAPWLLPWAKIVDIDLTDATLYMPYLYVEGINAYIVSEFYFFQYYYKEGTVWRKAYSPITSISIIS